MTTYHLNLENTGLDTDDQVKRMVGIMQADGHDVEYTDNFGAINPAAECPVGDQEWMGYLERADAEA